MITEIDAGHIIYDDLDSMSLERRLKGHLKKGSLNGEEPMISEHVPEEGLVVILPKQVSADKKYFNDCTIVVNILLKDVEGETNPKINELLKEAFNLLNADKVGEYADTWYRYSVRSHGIEAEARMKCHYANIVLDFEILNIR